jgi:hypothetical protein
MKMTISTSRNVNIYDDLLVMFRLFIMEVVSTVTNFVTSSQITSDHAKPLKIMTKLTRWSLNNEPISTQMNHSSSTHEEPMTKENWCHRTTTLSSKNNLKKENKDLDPHATSVIVPCTRGSHQRMPHMWATTSGLKFTKKCCKTQGS